MISLKEAKTKAEKEIEGLTVSKCIDIGSAYAFAFVGEGGMIIPGVPYVTVDKHNGAIDYMSIPPIENLQIIESGTVVSI